MKEKFKILIPGLGMIYCLTVIAIGLSSDSMDYQSLKTESRVTSIQSKEISPTKAYVPQLNYHSYAFNQNDDYLIQVQTLINAHKEISQGYYRP